jgi:hypothetical protein
MMKPIAALFLAFTLAALAGCAGRDFVRPELADLKLGQTTYPQVIAKLGEPRRTGELLKDGETIKTIAYAYASTGGEPLQAGVIPVRVMVYYFHRDVVVGREFLSSFKSDNSDFDETKISGIEKTKTTRAEVIQILGPPTALFLRPMVKETYGEAIGYTYQTTSGGVFSGFKVYRKALRITFDGSDKVLDVDYAASGGK